MEAQTADPHAENDRTRGAGVPATERQSRSTYGTVRGGV